ncbi:hypothetical protein EXU48_05820 [Occultella glacieicola]|uniref:AMIN-like domain-containing protein n=1 Tax=Occultella glacieicola TaxID=2518684 RepID=A0ABY2E5B8_9MICO|nr:hypothetical protein [Occultella glacieicola]TDE95781.1 hypothetical protein EXU48_05820 [Occultella glacieicola]
MTRSRHLLTLAAAGAALALLAGCTSGSGDDEPTGDATTATGTPSATETPSEPSPSETGSTDPGRTDDDIDDAPPFPADASEDVGEAAGEPDLMLADVRAAEHEDFDRVVLEFVGTGTPGWVADYVDGATEDGSGEPIDLEGEADLQISVSNTRYPNEGEAGYYDGPRQFEAEGDEIEEVHVAGTFEGLTQVVVGIDTDGAPFRVFALTDPVRVVLDVQHVED